MNFASDCKIFLKCDNLIKTTYNPLIFFFLERVDSTLLFALGFKIHTNFYRKTEFFEITQKLEDFGFFKKNIIQRKKKNKNSFQFKDWKAYYLSFPKLQLK